MILDYSIHNQFNGHNYNYILNTQLPKFGAEEHLSNCDFLFIKFPHDSVISFNNSLLILWFSFLFFDVLCRGKLQ